MPGVKRRPVEERFAGYLVKAGDDECWGWTGPTNRKGYPTIGRGGKGGGQVSARLLAYTMAFGHAPTGEVVMTCGTAECLNPRHFLLRSKKPDYTLRARFEAKIRKAGPDKCWIWTDKPGAAGYGRLSTGRDKNPLLAHRLAWELEYGPIPEGLLVRQRCSNRLCCNPAHLFLALNAIDSPEVSARAVAHWLGQRS